jgi:DsbC/DsbD-like thiol-disulfide interchange protein
MYYSRGACNLFFSLVAATSSLWAQPPTDMVKAELIADVSSVAPGAGFALGVRYHMKPGWHIYWHNPGESGLATSIRFELPEGVTAGPILWPAPERFDQPGEILGYGYTDTVLLAAKVHVKSELSDVSPLPIRAKTRWLACKEVCIPGSAELEIRLPVGDSPDAKNAPLFAEWEESLPVEPFSTGVQAETTGSLETGEFTIALTFKEAASKVEWFPHAMKALKVTDISVEGEGSNVRITFKAATMKGHELPSHELPSVVTFRQGGRHKAVRISVPLVKAK